MRNSIVAFLGFAFVIYWLYAGDAPVMSKDFSLGTITPTIKRIIEDEEVKTKTKPKSEPTTTTRSTASTPPAEAKASLQTWLNGEAMKIGQVDQDPAQTVVRLKEKALGLKKKDLQQLKRIALDVRNATDTRFLSIYMLGLAENGGAIALLKDVLLTQIPQGSTDRAHSDEVILRAQAVEAFVQKVPAKQARAMLRELLSRTSDPILARQAQYWLDKLG